MKKRRSPKMLIALYLAVCIVISGIQAYSFYQTRKSETRDAMSAHIAEVINNMNYTMERLYSVQALIVATNGQHPRLDDIMPLLNQADMGHFVRCISIAPNGIVTDVFPGDANDDLLGVNYYAGDHHGAVITREAIRTGTPMATAPFLTEDGVQMVSFRLAVDIPDDNGIIKNWGVVAIDVEFPKILEFVGDTADLAQHGYDYRMYFQHTLRSDPVPLFSKGTSDFSYAISSPFYILDQRIALEAVPKEGWLPKQELYWFVLGTAAALGFLGIFLELFIGRLRQLRDDASQDALTKLMNRGAAAKEIDRIIKTRDFQKGALLMLDLDNFKNVNDTFGHEQGDETLVKCAEQLKLLFRDSDIICRFGGDEFIVFLPFHSDMAFLNDKIERLLRAMRRDIVGDGAIVPISASVGIAIAPDHGTSFEELYHCADEALYRSKQRGRDVATVYGEFVYRPDSDFSPADYSFRSRDCILIIDNDFINREVLKNIFSKQYRFEEASTGEEGLKKVEAHLDRLSAILLDVNMPGMSGMELLTILHQQGVPYTVPVFLVTSHDDMDIAQDAYEMGVMDVIAKPVTPFVILRRVQSVIELYQARSALRVTVQDQAKSLQESRDTIDTLHRGTIEVLASAIEFRDLESGGHIDRIYGITKHILSFTAMGKGLTQEEIENIAVGSIMHDVGKIAVSDVILNKPGKLTREEFELMKTHTTKGAVLMDQLSQMQPHPAYNYARDIALHHHERWDGKGYPHKLKGDEIPVWAQVVSIADVYDALMSPRVYKPAYDPDVVVSMIRNGECGTFNPLLLDCFLQVEPALRAWYVNSAPKSLSAPDPESDAAVGLSDILLLTAAMQSAYDMMISVNLTRNTFTMLDYDRFLTHCAEYDGVFDDLIAAGASSVPESHRQLFIDTFGRESLLDAYARGEKAVRLVHPQYTDDGTLMQVATSVLFVKDPRSGDLRQITLARYI